MPEHDEKQQTAQERYEQLKTEREPYLQRAIEAAELTLPYLFMPEGDQRGQTLPSPYQSVGARGVNNLSSKLVLTLFPPGRAFFRFKINQREREVLRAQAGPNEDPVGDAEQALTKIEKAIMERFEHRQNRARISEAMRQILAGGNSMLVGDRPGGLTVKNLAEYVVKRNPDGQPIEMIWMERVEPRTLTGEARKVWESTGGAEGSPTRGDESLGTGSGKGEEAEIYHAARLERKSEDSDTLEWRVWKELNKEQIGQDEKWPKDRPRWLPLRWEAISGEDYGRGFVEQYLGDLRSVEYLSLGIVKFAVAAGKILWLVDESGVTRVEDLARADSGDFIPGDVNDIAALALEKFPDFNAAFSTLQAAERRLEEAFLLDSSVQRQAERVTAEEIRFMAGALERALGGVYTTLADELQRPLVQLLQESLEREDELPELPDEGLTAQIVTGIEGLGRSSELASLDILMQGIGQTLGPEALAEYVKAGALIERRATALGITDVEGMLRSEEEVQAQREAARQAALQQAATPQAVQGVSRIAEKAIEQGNAAGSPAQ